ncbi:MAG: bacillithiol system redox-active protein YtxJ [Haliscomenobacter sp.]|nr:bacillithiol system redox-active protein YtxJ [Haliscomenobacter sp.]MBK7477343.1 bacillithiol system redox-active protein YtxJ [Haliscomenobacter sp.]MBK8880073.1 bacillithiol system redox-active protein YtxJ [Haliscomenobacter sp.]
MSYLNHYLQSEELYGPWKVLQREEQLEELIALSHQRPVAIFKHSTRCGISAHAKYRLENEWGFSPEELEFFYLDLIAHRPLSNRIAQDFQVVHQSPQLILLRHGKAVFDASHHLISVALLRQALEA